MIRHVPGDLVSGACEYIHLEQLHSGAWSLAVYTGEGPPHLFDLQADGPIRLIAVDTSAEPVLSAADSMALRQPPYERHAFRAFLRRAAARVIGWPPWKRDVFGKMIERKETR